MRRIPYLEVFMVVIFFVGITITAALAASPPAPGMTQHIANQQKRIDQGIKSGTLTKDEAKILQDNLNRIQQEEKRLTGEGKLTGEERTRLLKKLEENSRMIEDKKNNPVKAVSPQKAVSPRGNPHIANQQKRIDQGIKSGTLTKDEAKIVQDNLNYVQEEEKRLAAAGKAKQADKERLLRILEQNSRMIEDSKGNPPKKLY